MRDRIEEIGRVRWPDARVVHELVCGQCRIDMAFIRPTDLIGVEIKSSRDVMDRAEKQMRVFNAMLPEVWVALAPKWVDLSGNGKVPYFRNKFVATPERVTSFYSKSGFRFDGASRNKLVYSAMVELLWADEARAIAFRHRLDITKRTPQHTVGPLIAANLTGYQIMHEVCRELRGREAFWKADAPILEAA